MELKSFSGMNIVVVGTSSRNEINQSVFVRKKCGRSAKYFGSTPKRGIPQCAMEVV